MSNNLTDEQLKNFEENQHSEELETVIRLTKELKVSQNLLKSVDEYLCVHAESNDRITSLTRLSLGELQKGLRLDIDSLQDTLNKL